MPKIDLTDRFVRDRKGEHEDGLFRHQDDRLRASRVAFRRQGVVA